MSLSNGMVGAQHSVQQITWLKEDGSPYNLTGATITARIRDQQSGVSRASDGVFSLITPTSGIFSWAYGALDVANPGTFRVQFVASYSDSKNDKTYTANWSVEEAL